MPTAIVITRYEPAPARPGGRQGARWAYHYTVDGGPLCQYGPGLTDLRAVLKRKYPDATITEAWNTPAAPAPAAEPAPWPAEGDQVAVYENRSDRVTVGTVERLTPTQVVLAGGAGRFYRHKGNLGVTGTAGERKHLRRLDDPEVILAQARAALNALAADVARIDRATNEALMGYGPSGYTGHHPTVAEQTSLVRAALTGILDAALTAQREAGLPADGPAS